MKAFKKIWAFALTLSMLLVLAACGGNTTSETNAAETTTADVAQAASLAGNYNFNYVDIYGDVTSFKVTIKDNGSFNILTTGALGNAAYTGTSWNDNGDGSFTTGAVEGAPSLDWIAEDGSITWTVDGSNVTPVGYTEPTEFQEKSAASDPANARECVGVYTFGEYNAEKGSTTPWIVWVNADGTYRFWRDNAFLGLRGFSGTWSYAGENVVDFSEAVFDVEGEDPVGDFFGEGYTSSWTLYGDGTCVPAGYEGTPADIDVGALTDPSIYPDGAEFAGVYSFGEYSAERGSTTPWIVWVNADGTYRFWRDNAFLGLRGFSGTWTYEGEGVFAFSEAVFDVEGEEPVGDFFGENYTSTWTFNTDGTCVPDGYVGTPADVDLSSISDPSLILG